MTRTSPGRNDPCPCGSGMKLKKCHGTWPPPAPDTLLRPGPGFSVRPKRTPEPIDYHAEKVGNEWVKRPGRLAMQLLTVPLGFSDDRIDSIVGEALKRAESIGALRQRGPQECLHDLRHKLYAVRYHHQNYTRFETEQVEEFQRDYGPPAGTSIQEQHPSVIYEVEAFLFQVRSSLDIVARFLAAAFGFSGETFGAHGDRVISRLERNIPKELAVPASAVATLIREAQASWIDETVRMRDEIAHRSALAGFSCFVQHPYEGGPEARIQYPTMPNGERVLDYVDRVYRELLAFCRQCLQYSLEAMARREQ